MCSLPLTCNALHSSSITVIVFDRIMSEVQHKMEQEAVEQEAAEKEPQQWKEVVEDIWREHLPHFRDDLYVGDGDFIFDAATGQYGFQYENESEGEDDLMGEDEEEVTEGDDEFSMVPEDDQTASAMPSHTSAKDDERESSLLICELYVCVHAHLCFAEVLILNCFISPMHSIQTNAGP